MMVTVSPPDWTVWYGFCLTVGGATCMSIVAGIALQKFFLGRKKNATLVAPALVGANLANSPDGQSELQDHALYVSLARLNPSCSVLCDCSSFHVFLDLLQSVLQAR